MVVMKNRQYSCLFNCWGVSRGLDKMMKARVKTWVRRKCLYHYDYPQKSPPQVARTSPKPTFIVELFCTSSEGVGFSRISLLLWKEWNCCGASVCAVEPFFVCRSILLLRKESAFCAFKGVEFV